MNHSPKVSVVIPVYNVEPYLRECLDSAAAQTLSKIEILCIDDGSTDKSGAICDEYAERDSRFRVFHQKNAGLSEARNVGMRHSAGEYILFVDSDDIIEPETCKKALDVAVETDADMTMFSFDLIGDSADIKCPDGDFMQRRVYTDNLEKLQAATFNWQTACFHLWKTSFLKENALEFIPGIHFEDGPFVVKATMLANRIATVAERLYHYRIRRDSITNANDLENWIKFPDVCQLAWNEIRPLDRDGRCLKFLFQANLQHWYYLYNQVNPSTKRILLNKFRQALPPETATELKTGRLKLSRHIKEFYLALLGSWYYRLKCRYRQWRLNFKKRFLTR